MICTAGIWTVREGREPEFERRWQESANAIAPDTPGVTFKLLRDRDEPRRYVSLGEGWRTPDQVAAVRETPVFQDAMASIWRLLESGDQSTLDLVAEIS